MAGGMKKLHFECPQCSKAHFLLLASKGFRLIRHSFTHLVKTHFNCLFFFIHLLYILSLPLKPYLMQKKKNDDRCIEYIGCSNSHSQFIMSNATILFFTFFVASSNWKSIRIRRFVCAPHCVWSIFQLYYFY